MTAAVTPIAGGIADCCRIGGFNVSALDPATDRFYVASNLLSDPPGSAQRLLGFDSRRRNARHEPFPAGGLEPDVLQAAVVPPPDCEAPVVSCNSPATITPPDAPISFTATASATDGCGPATVEVVAYDCWKFTQKGKRIDKTGSCVVEINGDTVTILDSGGVGDRIGWTVEAEDAEGNTASAGCEILVVNPGNG